MIADGPFAPLRRRPSASIAAAVLMAVWCSSAQASGSSLESFTQCVASSGAVFYGAHWCPYCAAQKRKFGDYADLLPYVECYEPGTRDKLEACDEVRHFPTWAFPDGSVRTGALSLATIARSTGCSAP